MGAAALGGAALVPFGYPAPVEGASFVAFMVLYGALTHRAHGAHRGVRGAFVLGLTFGAAANARALHSIAPLVHDHGHLPWAVAVAAAALVCLAQALPFALGAAVFAALAQESAPASVPAAPASALTAGVTVRVTPALSRALLFAASTVASQSLVPTLFPWRPGAAPAHTLAWIQLAELGGVPLLDACLAFANAAAVEALGARRELRRALPLSALAAAALALPLTYGFLRIPGAVRERNAGAPLEVGVLQPNVSVEDKHNPRLRGERLQALVTLTEEAVRRGAQVVVWPETAYPFTWRRKDVGRALLPSPAGVPLLAGAISEAPESAGARERRGRATRRRYNSTLAVDRAGQVRAISDKVHLLAFGEYTPLWDALPPLQRLVRRGLSAGAKPVSLTLEGTRFGVLNCYEDLFASFTRDVMADRPHVLVNVTNDAWFGRTITPHLHNAMARLRAVETRRDLVRAVNTGVSAHVHATGEAAVTTPTWHRAVFVAEVRRLDGETPWVRFGDVTTPLALLLLVGAAARRVISRRAIWPRPSRPSA